jgi:hypothetical protein
MKLLSKILLGLTFFTFWVSSIIIFYQIGCELITLDNMFDITFGFLYFILTFILIGTLIFVAYTMYKERVKK